MSAPSAPSAARPIATACVLSGITLLLYAFGPHPSPTSSGAAAISNAASHPAVLFFHAGGEQWLQPVAVYATKALAAIGAGTRSANIAATIAGALNVGLIFLAARMLWARDSIAIATAALLMLTPAHRALAQSGSDAIYPIAFVLLWLIAVLRFLHVDSTPALVSAGIALGLGIYSHPTAPLLMMALAIVTVVTLAVSGRRRGAIGALAAAFAVCLAPAALWFARHPDTYADTFGRWVILKAHARVPLDAVRAQVNWHTLGTRASMFWGYLDPSFLLFAPRGGAIAPFLVCSALLVPLGIHRLARGDLATRLLLLSAALLPPIVAATFGEAQLLANAAVLVAALTLVAGAGVASLRERRPAWTWIAAALAAASMVQLAIA